MTVDVDCRYITRKKEAAVIVDNIPTSLFAAAYDDHILLIVTQYDDIGSMIRLSKPLGIDGSLVSSSTLDVDVMMGPRDDLTMVYAKQIYVYILGGFENVEQSADFQIPFTTREQRSLILGIALKPMTFTSFKSILSALEQVKVW